MYLISAAVLFLAFAIGFSVVPGVFKDFAAECKTIFKGGEDK